MELALPHVVVRTTGPGIGTDLVAALAAHPVEVSEVRGLVEVRRAATGRQPMLVVLVCPPDPQPWIAEAAIEFPGVPILLFDGKAGASPRFSTPDGRPVEERPSDQPLQEICWQVVEALARAAHDREPFERRLGPTLVDLDADGSIGHAYDLSDCWFFPGPFPTADGNIKEFVQAEDRDLVGLHLHHAAQGPTFFPLRLLDRTGASHPMYAGVRAMGPGRMLLALQPLIDCAPIVGRRRGTRDPLTGLIDRWELWRQMIYEPTPNRIAIVMLVRLDAFETIAVALDFRQVDELFDRVASAIMQVFPWPSAPSRLTGGAFLLLIRDLTVQQVKARANRLIKLVNQIETLGQTDVMRFGLSIGIVQIPEGDPDLAVRLAETAVKDIHASGGNRAMVVRPTNWSHGRAAQLADNIELGSWEVNLQPVVAAEGESPEFFEALARFGADKKIRLSRPDFFATGRLDGQLERFDKLMLEECVRLLLERPTLKLSVNVTRETFVGEAFPGNVIDIIREAGVDPGRVILEVSPVCLTLDAELVRRRLKQLQVAGIAVALDDFGSGVCNLRHLTDYPLAMVKLDEMVTLYAGDDPLRRNFVRMVVNVCRARGIRTVAEFARTRQQVDRLREDGVDMFQGELFGMPKPVSVALATPAGIA